MTLALEILAVGGVIVVAFLAVATVVGLYRELDDLREQVVGQGWRIDNTPGAPGRPVIAAVTEGGVVLRALAGLVRAWAATGRRVNRTCAWSRSVVVRVFHALGDAMARLGLAAERTARAAVRLVRSIPAVASWARRATYRGGHRA